MAFTLIYTTPFKGWQAKELTIDYNSSDLCSGVELSGRVDNAIKLWNSVSTSRLKLKKGNTSAATPADVYAQTVPNITVVCHSTFTGDATLGSPDPAIIGIGTGIKNADNIIDYSWLFLNNDTGDGKITSLTPSLLEMAIAHELGHVFGLAHSEKQYALMYYGGYTSATALAADDRQGITYLYPRDELSGGAFGCGSISNSKNIQVDSKILFTIFLLLLPILIAGILRAGSRSVKLREN